MERERLDLLLKDPSLVDTGDLRALRELVDRHPWFSGAHLLLAAGEQTSGDVLADGTVQRAAAHIPSRQVLFDLVHEAPVRKKFPAAAKASAPIPEVPPATTTAPLEAEAASPALTEDPDAEEREQAVAATGVNALLAETEDDALTGQYEEAILASGYLVERDAPAPVALPAQDPGTAPAEHERSKAGPGGEPGTEEPARTVLPGTRMRFSDWLGTPSQPAARPTGKAVPDTAPDAQEQAPIGDLIDRFIQSQTPPPAPRAAFFKPQEAAKRSLDDEAGLVTETLAKLYAAQGNTAKAINAYHRLALKHPEKSSYFAALAKALEDKTSH